MKDRIRQIMESQHMTQQVFAQFIDVSPASLSSIYTGRTKPTLNIVEAIKKKIPDISVTWLMFGTGTMYEGHSTNDPTPSLMGLHSGEQMIDFENSPSPTPELPVSASLNMNGVKSTRQNVARDDLKNVDKAQRRVTEIRVFYDDQTWESFVPAKK